jgi:DNA repair photolyase
MSRQIIYCEKSILDHPRVRAIVDRVKPQAVIECEHYREVFNPKAQNFRLQKQNPAIILAAKPGKRVLATPEGFGIGGSQNYYFSHMLNCVYDCRYCFLQGMYPSAHHVIFVNYEDFMTDITEIAASSDEPAYFFSGYDCDSLAYDAVTGFLKNFLPFFAKTPKAILELRTKSVNVRQLLKHEPFDNCVVAFSFTPDDVSRDVEHGTPSVAKRIAAMQQCANAGWRVGLRFDPMILTDNFEQKYQQLFDDIFKGLSPDAIHSVSLGPLRFPEKMFQKVSRLYPQDKLLAAPLAKREKHFSYPVEVEQKMKQTVQRLLQDYVPSTLLFECHPL